MSNNVLHCQVLVVGCGSGGCAVAAKFCSKLGKGKVIVLEPAALHYYQSLFTLVGAGVKHLEQTYRPMASVVPKKAKWIRERAVEFNPNNNEVVTSRGKRITYDMLLVATGLELKLKEIPGLQEALQIPNGKVCTIYSPAYVDRTFCCMQNIKEGNAIFTFRNGLKCPGAPQKIMYLSEHFFRKMNKRQNINVIFNTSLPVIFGVKHYADTLWKITEKRNIQVNLRRNLIEIQPESDIAIFQNRDNPKEKFMEKYKMLHVAPPMYPPKELLKCKELVNGKGFVSVDKSTLQHVKYSNVFAIGDCSSTPNTKTAASAAAQSPVVFRNMLATMNCKPLKDSYDGYAACPIVTSYSTCIMAEFDYNSEPMETFPVNQNKERYLMYIMKKELMPFLYWNLMMKGYWNGPGLMRKMLSVFNFLKKTSL